MDNQPNEQNPVPQPPSQTTTPQPVQPMPDIVQPKKRKHPLLRIVLGVVIVLVLIIGFFVASFLKASSEIKDARVVSDQFVQAMVKGDARSAYKLTSSPFQQTTSESKLQELATVVNKNVTGTPTEQSWNINDTSGQPKTALINYSVSGSGGSGVIKTTIQKINSQWQVVYIFFPNFAIEGYTVQQ